MKYKLKKPVTWEELSEILDGIGQFIWTDWFEEVEECNHYGENTLMDSNGRFCGNCKGNSKEKPKERKKIEHLEGRTSKSANRIKINEMIPVLNSLINK